MKSIKSEAVRSNHAYGSRIATIAALMLLSALSFFSCRDEAGDKRGEPQAQASPAAQAEVKGRFAQNTYVNGVNVGGLNLSEAKAKLSDAVESLISSYECRLYHEGRCFVLGKNELNLSSNADEVLKDALAAGSGEYELTVLPLSDGRLESALDAISKSVELPARKAELLSADAAEGLGAQELARNSRFVVTAAENGLSVDKKAAALLVSGGAREAVLPVLSVPAEGEAPELPQRRAVFSTSYNSASLSVASRVHNIKKAAAILNARSLKPAQTLSCNEALGERTEESGWQAATAFASGGRETEQQYGGGICQVSTTLYNCALLADIEIIERIGHSRKVSYAEGGRDAALSWGSADLVIKNSTDKPIYIFMWTDDEKNCLVCEIYGEPFPEAFDEIAVVSELVEVTEPSEPEFVYDDTLKQGDCVTVRSAIRGRVYQTYREYRKNGAPLRRESVGKTSYPMFPALYALPAPEGEESDAPEAGESESP